VSEAICGDLYIQPNFFSCKYISQDLTIWRMRDFNYRAAAAAFENVPEAFLIAGIWHAGNRAAEDPVSFVSFHHHGLRFNRPDALWRIIPRIIDEQ
jgi:hypothetical protein